MNRFASLTLPLLMAVPCLAQWQYPPTRTVDAADTYFGKTYKDPYRWLENLKDKDVEAWFKAQADLTDGLLAKIPARDALAKEWMELDKLKPATYSSIAYENGRVFYKKTLGGENVGKLYFRQGWNGTEKLLFDPATYKAGVTTTIESAAPLCRRPLRRPGLSRRTGPNTPRSGSWTSTGEPCSPRASTLPTARTAGRWTASPSSTTQGRSPTSRASRSS